MKVKKLSMYAGYISAPLLFTMPLAMAGAKAHCSHLNIHLVTKPRVDCVLTHVYKKHGRITYGDIPYFISQKESVFTMRQENGHGPDIHLTYNCGGADIIIKSQQNFCLFKGGHISAKTDHPALVEVKTEKGHYGSDKPGNVYWTIVDKGSAHLG